MRIYLDMCCLKRPFDDQSQPRVRVESEAVVALTTMRSAQIAFITSEILLLENAKNPLPERAARVRDWLLRSPLHEIVNEERFDRRVVELMSRGLKNFDALHVATAEDADADVFVTADDRLLRKLRNEGIARFRVCTAPECVMEMPV